MSNNISQVIGLELVNINVYSILFSIYFAGFKRHGLFHFFQNLNLDKTSTNDKSRLAIPWGTSGQYQVYEKHIIYPWGDQLVKIAITLEPYNISS